VLGNAIVEAGADLLVKILPDWIAGKIAETPQDHSQATFTKKISKEDAEIDPADFATNANASTEDSANRAYAAFRKIQAYHVWPQAFFFTEKNGKRTRMKITAATFKDGKLTIKKVIPEGGKEVTY
jgi:methionyl-tRNA formyltransferase